jgi:hypothetical protein
MKQETKIRNALIVLDWDGNDDGRLCEKHDSILEHINLIEWANRRTKVIIQALHKLGLPNTACSNCLGSRGVFSPCFLD